MAVIGVNFFPAPQKKAFIFMVSFHKGVMNPLRLKLNPGMILKIKINIIIIEEQLPVEMLDLDQE